MFSFGRQSFGSSSFGSSSFGSFSVGQPQSPADADVLRATRAARDRTDIASFFMSLSVCCGVRLKKVYRPPCRGTSESRPFSDSYQPTPCSEPVNEIVTAVSQLTRISCRTKRPRKSFHLCAAFELYASCRARCDDNSRSVCRSGVTGAAKFPQPERFRCGKAGDHRTRWRDFPLTIGRRRKTAGNPPVAACVPAGCDAFC